jgi:iron(III) transport system ATP-binding protein
MTSVKLTNVTKSFGNVQVLQPLDLDIEEGSFTALLGPSGCGKTTILNLIGGLDTPTSGAIDIGGMRVFDPERRINLPAEKRNIGYVFQTYALWPHMTVGENVAYPLKIRGVARADREKQARDLLAELELGGLADRYPFQISGGQQQRVAIARALICRAGLLLLDEPLSNLDTQLRERARAWIAEVHAEFGLTTILVTHDQVEALSLSDRVILLDRGTIAQDGNPKSVYETPKSSYAADFVGGANLIGGTVVDGGEAGFIDVEVGGNIRLKSRTDNALRSGEKVQVVLRPNHIALTADTAAAGGRRSLIPFTPKTVLYQGANYEVVGETPAGRLRVLSADEPPSGQLLAVIPWDLCRSVPDTRSA